MFISAGVDLLQVSAGGADYIRRFLRNAVSHVPLAHLGEPSRRTGTPLSSAAHWQGLGFRSMVLPGSGLPMSLKPKFL